MYRDYNSRLKIYARELRTTSVSRGEKYLWKALLSRAQTGYKFKRQRPLDNFIVDFYCSELNLIIEIDGSSHLTKGENDAKRQARLENLGYTIIRFTEGEVLNCFDEVELQIRFVLSSLEKRGETLPPP